MVSEGKAPSIIKPSYLNKISDQLHITPVSPQEGPLRIHAIGHWMGPKIGLVLMAEAKGPCVITALLHINVETKVKI
jgi:hypothetical protein